jgi:hypothetical protein
MDDDEHKPGRRRMAEPRRAFPVRVPERDYLEAKAIAKRHNTSISDVYRASFRIALRVGKAWEPDA